MLPEVERLGRDRAEGKVQGKGAIVNISSGATLLAMPQAAPYAAAKRLGEPEEIDYGVLVFASDASTFCSGQTLDIHGGPGPAGV